MQASFRVGTWLVEPRRRLIRSGASSLRLEPKSMAVLCALARANGEPVSRDALIDAAWDGRVVSDDAVNRQVAKLRQALGDDTRAPRYIETIPKTGFRLLAPVSVGPRAAPPVSDGPPAPPPVAAPAGKRRWWPGLAAAAGVALLGFAIHRVPPPAPPVELRQVTAVPGLEVHPSPSPSGRAVVYATRVAAAEGGDYELFVQDLGSGSAVRLTRDAGDDLHPAWSPDGERIAFLHLDAGRCEIRMTTLYRGDAVRAGDCRDAGNGGGLSWGADGTALYFADRDGPQGPFALRRLDVARGEAVQVLAPLPDTLGDTTPRVAPDGRLGFLRVRTLGVEDAHVLAPDGEVRRVTFDDGKIHGLTWYDGRLVVASNRRGGLFGLWLVNPALGGPPQRLAAPPGADGPAGTGGGSTLVFEQWSSQVDLWSAPLDGGEPVPLLGSTRWDWWPAVSPDGRRLAWTSDRSGAAELWSAAPDGSDARRLTRFEGPYTQAAVWAPDSRSLVVAAPVDGQFDLFRVRADGGGVERLTRTPQDESAPLFAPDGRLMFRRDLEAGPALVDEAGRSVVEGVGRASFAPDGSLWFTRHGERGLWRLRAGAAERVTEALETVDGQNWWVDEDGVYLIERPDPDQPRLARLDPDTGRSTVVRELPALLYKSGLSRYGNAVIYARSMRHEADVYSLAPAR